MGGSNSTHAHSNYLICMRFIRINTVAVFSWNCAQTLLNYEDSTPVCETGIYEGHKGWRLALDIIGESVDSLCRDGADAQYMQYLSKSRITSPQTR